MSVRFRLGALAVATSLVAVAVAAACVDVGDASTTHSAAAPTTPVELPRAVTVSPPAPAATTPTRTTTPTTPRRTTTTTARRARHHAVDVHRHTYRTSHGGVVVAQWDAANLPSAPAGSVPWVAYVHGGGWVAGSPSQTNALQFCRAQVERGRSCFSLGYTLAPKAVWPRQQTEVDGEVAWIRRHAATFHLDPRAGFVIGHSAGGLMAMLAGLHDRGFAGMVSLDGATDVPYTIVHNADRHVGHDASLLVADAAPGSALARSASVTGNLDGDVPRTPALVIHETDDPVVDQEQSTILARGLEAAGVPVTYDLFPGRSHASELDQQPVAALDAWVAGRLAELGTAATAGGVSGG